MDSSQLRACIAKLVQVPDLVWAHDLLARAKSELVVSQALHLHLQQASADAAAHWTAVTGGQSQLQLGLHPLNPVTEINRYGVSVQTERPGPLDRVFIHFAMFDSGRKAVDVSASAVSQVETCIEGAGLNEMLGSVPVRDLVLWHEYYHVWMRQQERQQGQGQRRNQKDRRQEELAAILFSKLACGLSYNPQVLQWLLVYTEDRDLALAMMNDILRVSVKT